MLSGFRHATGTTAALFIVLAFGVYLLLPFTHPVYVVLAVPAILLGAVIAVWRINRKRPTPVKLNARRR